MAGIHIKKSHKGLLHKDLGVKQGEPIPASKLKVKSTDSAAVKKRKVFAQNAKKWHHGQDGLQLPNLIANQADIDSTSPQPIDGYIHNSGPLDRIALMRQRGILQDKAPDNTGTPIDPLPQPKKKRYNGEFGNMALTGLLAVDALIPNKKQPSPVVRPLTSYNEHPFGTGYSNLAEFGMKLSTTGYKSSSPDRKAKKLRIPSNKITMDDVPHNVMGIDNTGYTQLMTPNNDYNFPGSYVDEYPMFKKGGKMKKPKGQYISTSYQQGGEIPRLSPDEISHFNGFIDYVKKSGYQGSDKLNTGELSNQLYKKYNDSVQNKNINLPLDQLTLRAQNEQHYQKDFDVDFAQRKDPTKASAVQNSSISPKDAWFGSETSKRYIPVAQQVDRMNNRVVRDTTLGYVPNTLNKAGAPQYTKPVPQGAEVIETNEGKGYYDPTYGNFVKLGSGGSLSAGKAKEMLRDGTANGKKLTGKQKRYFGYVAGGGTPKAENGITMLDDNTMQFNGPSHAEGGMDISHGGVNAEVEGGETGFKSPEDGSLNVMGNMTNPLTGKKFKQDSKVLAKKEAKMDKLLDYSTGLVNGIEPRNRWAALKFNAGAAMMVGAGVKKQELIDSKQHLADVQQAMLDISNEHGIDPQAFSKGEIKAQKGYKLKSYQDGGSIRRPRNADANDWEQRSDGLWYKKAAGSVQHWDYRGTNTQGLDSKLTRFTQMLERKGLAGFSGPESGVSQRNTKSGNASRHQTGEALDAFFKQPDAYKTILNDPELSQYLIDNGLTAINEYDQNVAKKTGADAGHVHIGYDRGTQTADQFRQDASSMYKADHPDWGWGTTRGPKGKSLQGAPQGDAQYFPFDAGRVGKVATSVAPEAPAQPANVQPPQGELNLTPLSNKPVPTDTEQLQFNQILPELYAAATNRQEPVFAQKYQPELFEPYQVSFQDRRNLNNQTFRGVSQRLSNDPNSLGALAAQKYEADNQVNAEEFRTNQAIANDITNKNVGLLNDAQGKNLQIADTQYLRQSQAKSNTKAVNQAVLTSISGKIQQNRLENRQLQVYENLYPHFRFDEQYQLQKEGNSGNEYVNWSGTQGGGGTPSNATTKTTTGPTGKLMRTSVTQASPLKTQLDYERLYREKNDSLQKSYNLKKYTFTDYLNGR